MINVKVIGMLFAAFVAGSFVASPELRAYAANTVFSADIVDGQVMTTDLANNAVTAAKVKDGEIKAAEIATDAVGAAELAGVTKLLFGKCVVNSSDGGYNVPTNTFYPIKCAISGVDTNDRAIASLTEGQECFDVREVSTIANNEVTVLLMNECTTTAQINSQGTAEISIIVFDK